MIHRRLCNFFAIVTSSITMLEHGRGVRIWWITRKEANIDTYTQVYTRVTTYAYKSDRNAFRIARELELEQICNYRKYLIIETLNDRKVSKYLSSSWCDVRFQVFCWERIGQGIAFFARWKY